MTDSELREDLGALHSNILYAAQAAGGGGRTTTANVLESFADDVELLIEKHTDVDDRNG